MKSLEEKMNHPSHPEVKLIKRPSGPSFPAGKMLIPTPKVIESRVKRIRKGKTLTINQLRDSLAAEFKADYTCPLTTGIFLRIVAEYAELERSRGKSRITPYWRVVKNDGGMNPKFPGGVESQTRKLKIEGVKLVRKGKMLKVEL